MEPVQTITIPHFPLRYKVANKAKPVYWKKKHKNIPKKHQHLTKTDRKGFLLDEKGRRVIKNTQSVGKPKYVSIGGNTITSGVHPAVRSKMVKFLKNFYMPHVRSQLRPFSPEEYPLRVGWDFYSPVDIHFDMSNFWVYYKYFEDCLHMTEWAYREVEPIIPDDDRRYVTQPGAPLLWPVESRSERKFVFKFYTDNRQIVKEHPLWNTPK